MTALNRRRSRAVVLTCVLVMASVATLPLVAQQVLDRTKIPPPGRPPELRVPVWTKSTLGNGADLIVSEKHDLPLVSFSITLLGGASQFEPPARRGLASITASMMSEGTKTRDGEALSNALQLLGASVMTNIGSESGSMSFVSTTGKFTATLDILVDMLVNSTFPADALERLRAQRLVALTQARAQPAAIAGRVFPKVLYGPAHPFGQPPTEESLKAITRDDVVALHKAYFQPGRALIVVTGDVRAADVKSAVERALAPWTAGGSRPAFSYPALPERQGPTIYLVDKPGAAQSTFAIGNPGPPRTTPDYYALEVMNTMLGGLFQSRLNANIREEKGFSYGVRSAFAYGRGPGAFQAGGDIISAKTDAALVEFMKELRGIAGSRPVTDEELNTAKSALVQRLPGTFGSVAGINRSISTLWVYGLPDDYYQHYGKAVAAVTKDDVVRVARKCIDLDHLAIVIVGDRATIEGPLKATGIAPIIALDIEGNPQAGLASPAAQDLAPIKLPAPKTDGGKPLMQALKERQSSREFTSDKLLPQTISNLLWAAWGINRPDGRRTAPSASNRQEIDIYVTLPEGAYVYDAKANTLNPVASGDLRAATGTQPFPATAALNLLYVADMGKAGRSASDPQQMLNIGADAGFISENVYLFCASEGLATVVRASVDKPGLARQLKLRENQVIVLAQSVGYPVKK
jgi:zinc protease